MQKFNNFYILTCVRHLAELDAYACWKSVNGTATLVRASNANAHCVFARCFGYERAPRCPRTRLRTVDGIRGTRANRLAVRIAPR